MPSTFADALAAGVTTPQDALALFDRLDPVPLAFLFGTWHGAEFPTGHRLDGLLAASGWYGKHFADAETVHPLLFHTPDPGRVFALDPGKIPLNMRHVARLPLPRPPLLRRLLLAARPLLQTHEPTARLRMTEHRGQFSAAMIYDDQPIIDHFRQVDPDTVLGLMDLRGLAQPYFFVLRRDSGVTIV